MSRLPFRNFRGRRRGATEQDDAFPLKANHMALLRKYAHSAMKLPTTLSAYTTEFSIAGATAGKFRENIETIVKIFQDCVKHAEHISENTLPVTNGLAESLVDHAKDANSYYKPIFDAIILLDNSRLDAVEFSKRQKELQKLINDEIGRLGVMTANSEGIVSGLQELEKAMSEDETKLRLEVKAFTITFDDQNDDIAKFANKAQELRVSIQEAERSYEEILSKTNDIPKWSWIPYFGWIGLSRLSELSEEARRCVAQMNQDKARLGAAEAEYASCQNMFLSTTTMIDQVHSLLGVITPVIRSIQFMQGAFGSISDDLKIIKRQVDENVRQARALTIDVTIESILGKWESLGKRGEKYLQVANIDISDIDLELEDESEITLLSPNGPGMPPQCGYPSWP